MSGQPDGRLDSWKAIATYLGRDERTVRRWEREKGLPVRRVAGDRGASVFAFTQEIDSWLAGPQSKLVDEHSLSTRSRWPWLAAGVATATIAVAAIALMRARGVELRVELTPSALIAFDQSGAERWRYPFPGERVEAPSERTRHPAEVFPGMPQTVLAATQLRVSVSGEIVRSGQLLLLNAFGELQRMLTIEDRLMIGGIQYGPPWGITDFRVDPKSRRTAVAAHHHQWWPSIVTIVDEGLNRRATFVNEGWAERVHWLSADRLMIAGFNEAADGGMVALLDAHALNGQSPAFQGSRLTCSTCGPDRPIRYLVMPRSEINRVTGARFNRARIEVAADRIVVRTVEATFSAESVADGIYEFTTELDLIRTSYSERYWELHRQLEAEKKLDHERKHCPDRNGPRTFHIWDRSTGWRQLETAKSGASAIRVLRGP